MASSLSNEHLASLVRQSSGMQTHTLLYETRREGILQKSPDLNIMPQASGRLWKIDKRVTRDSVFEFESLNIKAELLKWQ